MDYVYTTLHIIPFVMGLILIIWLLKSSFVYIGNGTYGVPEKLWSFSPKKRTGFIALNGEPGYQPDIIMGGWHMFMPFQYRIHKQELITVKGIAYLFARDGAMLSEGQANAQWPSNVNPGDARAFLIGGGQQGPQRFILRQGLHAINTALFAVFTEEGTFTIDVGENSILEKIDGFLKSVNGYNPIILDKDGVGIVTVNDGPSLEHGEIVAPTVGTDREKPEFFHNSFQSIEKFLLAGGRRGRQEQVLVEGTYYINRLFAIVEITQKEIIPIGFVGVVNSYAGMRGQDVSGADFTHGELVENGQKGIWRTPWQPGKYAINPYAMIVRQIPTTNLVLRWQEGSVENHGYDRNLKELRLITKDAFEPIVGVSLVIHIAKEDAPYVVQQFSDIQQLVDQTLDTILASWFKDAVQGLSLTDFISKRAELQVKAKEEIGARFKAYKLSIQEIMLGTPRSAPGNSTIETVYEQLRARQLSVEQTATFEARKITAATEKSYNEAKAIAENQTALTASDIQIKIAENNGAANVKLKSKEAEAIVLLAEADARRVRLTGDAEASKITAIGTAEASAAKAQVDAYGGPEKALQKAMAEILANALANSSQPIVPQIIMGGTANGDTHGGLPSLLSSLYLKDGKLNELIKPTQQTA